MEEITSDTFTKLIGELLKIDREFETKVERIRIQSDTTVLLALERSTKRALSSFQRHEQGVLAGFYHEARKDRDVYPSVETVINSLEVLKRERIRQESMPCKPYIIRFLNHLAGGIAIVNANSGAHAREVFTKDIKPELERKTPNSNINITSLHELTWVKSGEFLIVNDGSA